MDVGGWLRRLGLEQYEAAFRENEIDDTVLPSLTAEDLKDLDVGFVGHRRKLLDAIAALRAKASAPTPLSNAALETDEPGKDTAERRQVTVMFADLVGSTALSARMDPEDLREVISAYQRCVAETVRRFRGFVARYMGDGVLIFFGYPAAHEDDAELAVRSGLALIDSVAKLPAPEPLQVRVGVATGIVVVGDIVGSGEAQEHDIVGETPNLAARLQGIAEPNTVVIAEATRTLLGNLFKLQDLGPKELKGIVGPVRAFAALRASSVESRFEAMHPDGLTELVGREEELELLRLRWAKAKTGEGQVVLLSGEAGIGKSRLSAALMEAIAAEPHTRLRYFCSPQHTDSAFYPIIGQLERATGFTQQDDTRTKLDKLDALLARTSTSAVDAALFAGLLSLPNDGRHPTFALTPRQRRQKMLEALNAQIEALKRKKPVLMIFEDAHWIDPSSLEALSPTVERIRGIPMLLIVTSRPEFAPPWAGQAQVTRVVLNRLGEREVATIIRHLVGDKRLRADVMAEIVERTDGVPLFIEELTKAVLETDHSNAKTVLSGVGPNALAVPATLHASLMARLDRLGSAAKEVAQVGAAIGREFSYELLAAVVQRNAPQLDAALDQLVGAGLAFRQGMPPQATFLFKHALVQDAAYGTLLRGKRRDLHRCIVRVLEEQFPDTAEAQPEVLAYHCAHAGLIERAIGYYEQAAQRAIARSAMTEAVAQLNKGLELLTNLPDDAARQRQEFELLIALGKSLMVAKGYASPEVGQTYARAVAICERLGYSPKISLPAVNGQWVYHIMKGELRPAKALATDIVRRGENDGDSAVTVLGHRSSGIACFHLGELSISRTHLEKAIATFDPVHRPFYTALTLQDVYVTTHTYLSHSLFCLGCLDKSRSGSEKAIEEARQLNPYSITHSLSQACFVDWATRSHGELQLRTDATIAVAAEQGFPFNLAVGTIFRGWARAMSGQSAEGVALLRDGLTAYRATGAAVFVPFFLTLLAEALGKTGHRDQGLQYLGEAGRLMAETEERWADAELHRARGELLGAAQNPVAAEHCFGKALAIARQQGTKFWELRAAMSMARLWRDQGKRDEARELLAPVYGWFTEGFDTHDLREAKALLAELAP
jgi:class 3 adenylate cyclase/predicted ATPase